MGTSEEGSKAGITRRGLIGVAGAAGAAAALPGRASASAGASASATTTKTADVAIVGAGLAGLAAATALVKAGKSVVILEARTRVGGRTLNRQLEGGRVVEAGGQWFGPTQDRIITLYRSLGFSDFKTWNTGENIYEYSASGSQPLRYTGAVPTTVTSGADSAITDAIVALEGIAAQPQYRATPWNASNALELDSMTFDTWKRQNVINPEARFLVDLATTSIFAAEPRDISALAVASYAASAGTPTGTGSFNRLISVAGGAQERRLVGGSQQIALKLASNLGAKRIVLDSPVRMIAQTSSGVTVTSDKAVVKAKRAIVTGPPSLAAGIRFTPALPPQRAQLQQRYPQGSAIKCYAFYKKPFWREDGLTGQVTTDREPWGITFDNSPPDGSIGCMLAFIEGHSARVWGQKTRAERRARLLADLPRWFGSQAGADGGQLLTGGAYGDGYFEMSWAEEEWTRGCYVGFTPPGVLTDYGPAIRAAVGRVHWAGAEYATVWNGYMEGAVRSGEEQAAAVIAAGL